MRKKITITYPETPPSTKGFEGANAKCKIPRPLIGKAAGKIVAKPELKNEMSNRFELGSNSVQTRTRLRTRKFGIPDFSKTCPTIQF